MLGYDVDPQGGRLVVNAAEAERVREIFAISAGYASLAAAQQEIQARRLLTKDWTSKAGKHHRCCGFTRSPAECSVAHVRKQWGARAAETEERVEAEVEEKESKR